MGRPISEDDFHLILAELKKPGVKVSLKQTPRAPRPGVVRVLTRPRRVRGETMPPAPSHDELVEMLRQIGEILGFVSKKEDWTPGRVYRCDVTWRDYEPHAPMKVFEVEFAGNVDHALSSLAHAYDIWRSEQLYLIVADERDKNRVERLVEPRLMGAFSRLRGRLRVLTWIDIKMLYDSLAPHSELVKDMARR